MSRYSDSLILQLYARTPAPCRDYCGLTVTTDEVILNIWNVTYGPHVYPKRQRRSLEDFSGDKHFQSEVHRIFGAHVLEYVTSIARNEKNLRNLPEKVFLHVLKYLAMKDILNLTQTSKIMFELCNTDNTWKILFSKYFKQYPTQQDAVMAVKFGWKSTLRQKMDIRQPESNRKNKVPATKSKANIKQKQVQNNIKHNMNTINIKKEPQSNIRNNNNIDKKGLPSKVGNSVNLLGQKKDNNNRVIKINANPRGVEKNCQIVGKNTNVKNRIDSTKSSSILVAPKTPILNNLKINQTKSVANINNPVKNTLQKTKNRLNVNNIKSNTEIKIEIPSFLEGSAACNPKLKSKSAPKTPILNNLKINQTKNVANINHPVKNTLQKTTNSLNVNNIKPSNTEIKIEIPSFLEGSAACNPKLKSQSGMLKINTNAIKNKISLLRK